MAKGHTVLLFLSIILVRHFHLTITKQSVHRSSKTQYHYKCNLTFTALPECLVQFRWNLDRGYPCARLLPCNNNLPASLGLFRSWPWHFIVILGAVVYRDECKGSGTAFCWILIVGKTFPHRLRFRWPMKTWNTWNTSLVTTINIHSWRRRVTSLGLTVPVQFFCPLLQQTNQISDTDVTEWWCMWKQLKTWFRWNVYCIRQCFMMYKRWGTCQTCLVWQQIMVSYIISAFGLVCEFFCY